jgi:hypothetical protein
MATMDPVLVLNLSSLRPTTQGPDGVDTHFCLGGSYTGSAKHSIIIQDNIVQKSFAIVDTARGERIPPTLLH